jgi:membrane protease YdiL (CAAX protease family)
MKSNELLCDMEINIGKSSHILAIIILLVGFILVFVSPIVTYFMVLNSPQLIQEIEISEYTAILSQLILMAVLVLVPISWYILVNRLKSKQMLFHLKLVRENIAKAVFWGILAAIVLFFTIITIEAILLVYGFTPEELSNIPDVQRLFSPTMIFLLVTIQPISEEIFFRGFLLEKIDTYAGDLIAIIVTAVLFGIAHLAYGKIFPAIMPIIMGIILGIIVIRTRNLYSAIIAHVTFNVTAIVLTILA